MSPPKVVEDEEYLRSTRTDLLRAIDQLSSERFFADEEFPNEHVEKVLDLGCGIGRGLLSPALGGALGVGVDLSEKALRLAKDAYAEYLPGTRTAFLSARAEILPFKSSTFDLVHCSLALPYMRNRMVIAEIARILRPGGVLLLKIHHARYYVRRLLEGLKNRDVRVAFHGARVLFAGTVYHLSNAQPAGKFLDESYQTRWLLRRELKRAGLLLERESANTNPQTPAFIIRKPERR